MLVFYFASTFILFAQSTPGVNDEVYAESLFLTKNPTKLR
jgi:hypothetical protein